jgi:hypothetical protein
LLEHELFPYDAENRTGDSTKQAPNDIEGTYTDEMQREVFEQWMEGWDD